MEWILGWIIFSVVAGAIAAQKKRTFFGTFLLSLVLSPLIGIIVAFALAPGEKIEYERAVREGEYRKCPMCAEMIKNEAVKCKFCGSSVEPMPPPPQLTLWQKFNTPLK